MTTETHKSGHTVGRSGERACVGDSMTRRGFISVPRAWRTTFLSFARREARDAGRGESRSPSRRLLAYLLYLRSVGRAYPCAIWYRARA